MQLQKISDKILTYITHSDLGTWTEGDITVTNRYIKITISCINNNVLHICNVRKSPTEKPKYLFPPCSWHFSGKCYMFPPQLTRLTVINKRRIVHPQMEYTYFSDTYCAIRICHWHSCSFLADTLIAKMQINLYSIIQYSFLYKN